jgi:hypothetical protein
MYKNSRACDCLAFEAELGASYKMKPESNKEVALASVIGLSSNVYGDAGLPARILTEARPRNHSLYFWTGV